MLTKFEPRGEQQGQTAARILIVEDNPGDVFVMEEALREHQINGEVAVVSDGEAEINFFHALEENPALYCPHISFCWI